MGMFSIVHDSQDKKIKSFSWHFKCMCDPVPATSIIREDFVKGNFSRSYPVLGERNMKYHCMCGGLFGGKASYKSEIITIKLIVCYLHKDIQA